MQYTTSLLEVNLKRIFNHSSFHIMSTTIYLTHPKSISKTINNIISCLELVKGQLECLLNILRDNDKKFEKYWLVFGQILFKTPCFSKIMY